MGRNWSPKYKCKCRKCGWKGKRTGRIMGNPCPQCSGMVDRTQEKHKKEETTDENTRDH